MPRGRYEERDALKELYLGRQGKLGLSGIELAEKAKMSREHLRGLWRKASDEWSKGDIKALAKALELTMNEVRAAFQ